MSLCNKKVHKNSIPNIIQRIFCKAKKNVKFTHTKIIQNTYKYKNKTLAYAYISLLAGFFILFNFITFNKTLAFSTMVKETVILMETPDDTNYNEGINLEEPNEETISSGDMCESENVFSWTEIVFSWTDNSWENILENIIWELNNNVSGEKEEIDEKEWEIFTWIFVPDNVEWLLLWLDANIFGSFSLDWGNIKTWSDKRNNWIIASMDEESRRPRYENNIISGYPAVYFDDIDDGLQTNLEFDTPYTIYIVYNKQNPYLENARVIQWLNNWYVWIAQNKIINFALQGIVWSSEYLSQGFVINEISNDWLLSNFYSNGQIVTTNNMYTESPTWFWLGTFWFAQSEPLGWYVSEVLIYNNILSLEDREQIANYLNKKYFDLSSYSTRTYEIANNDEEENIEESALTWDVDIIWTWENTDIDSPLIWSWIPTDDIAQWNIEENLGTLTEDSVEENKVTELEYSQINQEIPVDENIIIWYFTKAYEKWVYSPKIIELQKMLVWLQLYDSVLDGVMSNTTLEAVYQYQLQKNILTPQDRVWLRGYMWPSTRIEINQTYIQYQLSLLNMTTDACKKNDMVCRKERLQDKLFDKWYKLTQKWLVRLSNQSLVGSKSLDMSQMEGEFVMPIILQSINTFGWNLAEVQIPSWTILKTSAGERFVGELTVPEFLDPETIQNNIDEDVISIINVWSNEHIQFEDENGNYLYATFRMPAPGMNDWDTIDVNYSEDGVNRIYLDSVEVQLINGEPYAVFEASHFTTFYLGNTTGTFTIANDATYATGLAVTLNNSVPWATQMRFGNTIAERDAASWVTYSATRSWNLAVDDGIKRVYAQFSGNGVIRNVSDSIILDMSSGIMTNGLQLHLNGTTWTKTFLDIWTRNSPFTIAWTSYKQIWSGEDVMYFNWTNWYAQNTSTFITKYPFTISAWVKVGKITWTQGIVMFGGSNADSKYYGIQLDGGKASMVSKYILPERTFTAWPTLTVGQRVHIVGVFNKGTSRELYVNGVSVWEQTSYGGLFNTANPRWRLWAYPWSTTSNYYSWNIDEVRIYDKSLTTAEISDLYMDIPKLDPLTTYTATPTLYGEYTSKTYLPGTTLTIDGNVIATTGDGPGRWKTVPFTTGLADGSYDVTLNYTTVYGQKGTEEYINWLIVNAISPTILYETINEESWMTVVSTLIWLDPTYRIVNNSWSEFHTFTGDWSFIYQFVDNVGTTWSITAMVDWFDEEWLIYSTTSRFENTSSNDGSIDWDITVTLLSGFFSSSVANYISLSNIPLGLTPKITLSEPNKVVIELNGFALNNESINSVENISLSFLTGAFSGMNPKEVPNSTQTWISIVFYDRA